MWVPLVESPTPKLPNWAILTETWYKKKKKRKPHKRLEVDFAAADLDSIYCIPAIILQMYAFRATLHDMLFAYL